MDKLVPVHYEDLPNMIGKGVHCSWASHGHIWILDSVVGTVAHLRTPKTHKKITTSISSLLYTRTNEPKL